MNKMIKRILLLSCLLTGSYELAVASELKPGEVIGRHIFGLAVDVNSDPLMVDGDPLIYDTTGFEKTLVSGENSFKLTGFNHVLGGLYVTQYDQREGRLIDTVAMDLPAVEGLSKPMGGTLSGWGSVLFGESQVVDAASPNEFAAEFKHFYKGKAELVKPYNYGWVGEAVLLDDSGKSKVIKNYAVGRVAASQLHMMPDGRSLYMHDAESSGLLYLFVSAEENSLAEGALYAVSLQGSKPVLEKLGAETALRMKLKLRRMAFKSLFDKVETETREGCPEDFSFVSTIYGNECLKIKKKNKRYTGLFEPIRTLALKQKSNAASAFKSVSFDNAKSVVELEVRGKSKTSYQLGDDAEIGSSYVIQ